MSSADEFERAQQRVKALRATPSNEELLDLYGLYKQATTGDVKGSRPSMLDFKGRAKYDAWQKRAGLAHDRAMSEYVNLVERLVAKYG
jgi:acyl-CoA-binding protein